MDSSLENKGHQHGFHDIVLMMGICHLLAAQFFDGLVQGAFPHLCAEGTGIFLLALLEDDLCDIGLDDGVRHFQFPAQILNLIQVEVPEAQIYCDRMDVEPFRIEAPQALERIEKREAVFAAGADFSGPMPGKSAVECGNYRNLEVSLAKEQCAYYRDLIRGWTVEKLAY